MRKTLDDFQLSKTKNVKEIQKLTQELSQLKALRRTDQNYFDLEFKQAVPQPPSQFVQTQPAQSNQQQTFSATQQLPQQLN